MTPQVFIQSYKIHKKGDKGFCKLASISTKNAIYDIGFCFEVIKNSDKAILLSVQSNSWSKTESAKKTLIFKGTKELAIFLDDVRLNIQDEISSLLLCSVYEQNSIQFEFNLFNKNA